MKLGLFRFWRHLRYHRDILKHLRWTAIDEQRKTFYRALIPEGTLIFDVGANMGNRSKIFRSLGCPVVAFEPQSHCADFLQIAFAEDQQFTLVRTALSNQRGELLMHLSDAHTLSTLDTEWMNTLRQGKRFDTPEWKRSETVKVATLTDEIERHGVPHFIKIDVEGHEYPVLSGLQHPVKGLSLEFASESENNIKQCIDHLDTIGDYQYRLSLGESMVFESPDWLSSDAVKSQMTALREKDPLVWGDLYARLANSGEHQ